MAEKKDHGLKCSFCGKSQDAVRKLIAGPSVYICDECVQLCNELFWKIGMNNRVRCLKNCSNLKKSTQFSMNT